MRPYAYSSDISPIARKQTQLATGLAPRITGAPRRVGMGYLGLTGTAGGAASGAAQGASIGSAVPLIGTAIGAIGGAIGGAIAGTLGKTDPEQRDFASAVALWQQNPNAIYNIGNKYLPLAGLFDLKLKGPHIPIYQKYGRMGEERFTADLVRQIYQAAQSGKITASDTPMTIMVNVVQPWIDSWGFGPMQDPHQDLINKLIIGMIADYTSGAAPNVWRSRSGPLPASFAGLPPFGLPQAAAPPPARAPAAPPPAAPPPAAAAPPAPVPIPAPTAAPSVVLTADGSTVTAPGTGLRNSQGLLFYFGNQAAGDPSNVHGYPVWINNTQNGYLFGMLLANGGQLYGQNDANWFQWTGANWVNLPGPPQIAAPSQPAPPQPTLPPVSVAPIPLPSGYQPPLPGPLPPSPVDLSSIGAAPIPAPAPLPAPITTAGATGAGLPQWVTWGAVAAGAYLLFATARPARSARSASRGRRARP